MKKFILFILITIVVTTSYGFFNFDEKNDKKEVTSAFENYINAAQNEDVKTINEYHIIWRNVWRTSQESYKYLTYKINDVKIINEKNENGKKLKFAYVNVSLKYPDLNYAMSKFYKDKDFNSLVKGKSTFTQMEIIEKEVSTFLKNELKKNDIKYIEKKMTVKFEYIFPIRRWRIPEEENVEFLNILSLDAYKIKGMEKTIGEIARTPVENENTELLIKEKEAEIKNKTAKIDDYKLLLIFYSPVNNPDNYNFERIAKEFIKNFPDYPEAYFIMADFLFHTSQDYQEILNYTQKGIEAYKNVDINKYPEFTYENSRNHPMNELYVNMIEVYLKKGEKDKAIDVFNKNKKIIKYWMPPANYAQLIKKLGVEW